MVLLYHKIREKATFCLFLLAPGCVKIIVMTEVNDTKKIMLMTLVSANVRIFGPVMVGFLVGLVVDLNAGVKPWGMAIGTGLGVGVGGILVYRQLKNIREAGAQQGSEAGAQKKRSETGARKKSPTTKRINQQKVEK